MKILVDGDACPVKEIVEEVAGRFSIPVIVVASYQHRIQSEYSQVVVVDHQPEAADLYIVNHTARHDIVVTQDLGLAALILAKGGRPITSSGHQLKEENMDALLAQRYIHKKSRRQGYRIGKTPPRTRQDDQRFQKLLTRLLADSATF